MNPQKCFEYDKVVSLLCSKSAFTEFFVKLSVKPPSKTELQNPSVKLTYETTLQYLHLTVQAYLS
jgi:hypothetical protein